MTKTAPTVAVTKQTGTRTAEFISDKKAPPVAIKKVTGTGNRTKIVIATIPAPALTGGN